MEKASADAKRMLKESHHRVMTAIATFSDDDAVRKRSLSWTGGSTLGAYCVSATSSHYDRAMKKIKRHTKTCGL
jgi:hypothetical protein